MATRKIIVAHPGKQHVFQLLKALKQEGILFKFITTVYDKENSLTNRAKKLLKGKDLKKASSRKSSAIADEDVILFSELGGLFLIFLSRLGVDRAITDFFYRLVHRRFALKVAKYAIKNKVDAVVMFDSNVYDGFEYLAKQAPGIVRILDVTIASRVFMKEIYKKDMDITGDSELYEEQKFLWNDTNLENYKNEFLLSDYLLVGSEFVRKSVLYSLNSENKIRIIPYGVDIAQFRPVEKTYTEGPLKLFFVGGITRRKGVHHLLNVVSKYTKDEVVVSLAGAFSSKSDLFLRYKDFENINFEGFVTRDIVAAHYAASHVFVLPSLAEGLALVGLEALASGLPILCTENTGTNDLIVDGINGFVIPASDVDALTARIDWFIKHREEIERMGRNARSSVENYSWDTYNSKIIDFFNSI